MSWLFRQSHLGKPCNPANPGFWSNRFDSPRQSTETPESTKLIPADGLSDSCSEPINHAAQLLATGAPVVLAGDYNVVPTAQDIYPTKSLDDNALIQPASRQAFERLLAQGWTDALRKLQPHEPLWTFWDYKRGRWPLDKGMRLDHFLLSPEISKRLTDGGVDRWVRGEENASDHAPVWIALDF